MNLTRRFLEASTRIERYVQGVSRVDAIGDQAAEDEAPAPRGPQGLDEDATGDRVAEGGGPKRTSIVCATGASIRRTESIPLAR